MFITHLHVSRAHDSIDLVTGWVSANKKETIDLVDPADCLFTAANAMTDLLGRCTSDDQRERIMAGRFVLAR